MCTVVDWNDRRSDRGFRIYGTLSESPLDMYYRSNWNPQNGRWTLLFKKLKEGKGKDGSVECDFRFGGELVKEFTAVSCEGYIGFWGFNGTGMTISELSIDSVF